MTERKGEGMTGRKGEGMTGALRWQEGRARDDKEEEGEAMTAR